MSKTIIAAGLLAVLAGPALAQSSTTTTTTTPGGAVTTEQFYVVRDPATRRCTVTASRPTSTSTVVVGDTVYKTRTEAEGAVTKVCTN